LTGREIINYCKLDLAGRNIVNRKCTPRFGGKKLQIEIDSSIWRDILNRNGLLDLAGRILNRNGTPHFLAGRVVLIFDACDAYAERATTTTSTSNTRRHFPSKQKQSIGDEETEMIDLLMEE
jgi:hypothetical protein